MAAAVARRLARRKGYRCAYRVISRAELESIRRLGRLDCEPSTGYEFTKLFWEERSAAHRWEPPDEIATGPHYVITVLISPEMFEAGRLPGPIDDNGRVVEVIRENLNRVVIFPLVEAL